MSIVMDKKKAYQKIVAQRIKFVMDKFGISQTEVALLAQEKGFDLKQSTLSKMLSEPYNCMGIRNITEVAKTLNIDLNELLSFDGKIEISVSTEPLIVSSGIQSLFIRRADAPQMRAYLNSFNTYFFPTKSSDKQILAGKLRFYSSANGSKCIADFRFKTGKTDENNHPIEKKYIGELILSPTMSAAYCTFINEEIGEISYMLFSYMPILFEKLRCRVALVLTSSAGDHRMPTAHRMIISEDELSADALDIIQGQLYLNESEILISEMGLEKFLQDSNLDESFKAYFCKPEQITKLAGLSSIPYYRFDESIIRESFLEEDVITNAICLIRKYSSAPKYNKIGSKSDELLYRFVTRQK